MGRSIKLDDVAAGHAALAICESLLLALKDLKIIAEREAGGVLEDAAAAHRTPNDDDSIQEVRLHLAVAAILDRISAGQNGTHSH